MARSQRFKGGAELWRTLTDMSKGQWWIKREWAIQVEPPAWLRALLE